MDNRIQELKEIIRDLEKENEELRNENESLWFMLDETKEADKEAKREMDEAERKFLIQQLSKQKPVGDA
tara:strand:- start:43 stop:249 length:207 start_codon:yes stop_codon:yes gene_type:complete